MKKRIGILPSCLVIVATSLALINNTGYAEVPLQSHESIHQQVEQFVHNEARGRVDGRIEVNRGRLDPRLRLVQCTQAIQAFLPTGTDILRTNTVGVRCDGQQRWSIFVPMQLKIMAPVLLASRPIAKGEIINQGDFNLVDTDISQLHKHYFQNPADIIGKVAKTPLRQGNPISQNEIAEPMLIQKGDTVTITAKMRGLTVSMKGIALENGTKGQLTSVKNIRSGKIVHATTVSSGNVEIPM